MNNLLRLNLAGNNLSGQISPGFGNLAKLRTLSLENNQLSGSIPDLNLGLRHFNVSNNSLNGSIPRGLRNFSPDAFLGNSLCGMPLGSCPNSGNKLSGGAIAGIVIACVVVLIIVIVLIFLSKYSRRRKRSVPEFEIPRDQPVGMGKKGGGTNGFPAEKAENGVKKIRNSNGLVFLGDGLREFDLEELLRASAEVLGKGTCGTTYKAMVEERGVEVVVKRLRNVCVYEREFVEEVERLGGMVHENLASIRAYYCGREEKLLIYDCLPMGNLSSLLHGKPLIFLLCFFSLPCFDFSFKPLIRFTMIELFFSFLNTLAVLGALEFISIVFISLIVILLTESASKRSSISVLVFVVSCVGSGRPTKTNFCFLVTLSLFLLDLLS